MNMGQNGSTEPQNHAIRTILDSEEAFAPAEVEAARHKISLEAAQFVTAETAHFSSLEDEALSIYSKLADNSQGTLYGYLASGQIAVIRGSMETALAEFLSAQQAEDELLRQKLIFQPEDRVRIHLGLTYRKLGHFDEAIAAFESVNSEGREHPNAFAYAGIASVYRSMMRSDSSDNE